MCAHYSPFRDIATVEKTALKKLSTTELLAYCLLQVSDNPRSEMKNRGFSDDDYENACDVLHLLKLVTAEPGEAPARPKKKRAVYDERFERFWRVYPRKAGDKRKAERVFLQIVDAPPPAMMPDPEAKLMQAVQAFADECQRNGTAMQYIPHCLTWLNQSRYMNYLNQPPTRASRGQAFGQLINLPTITPDVDILREF